MEEPATVKRPPVALGCGALLIVLIGIVALFGACIAFLESGADTGKVTLKHVDAYPPGSVEFVGEENLFIVRTSNGEVLAISDLDAANRANQARRCRVHPANVDDPLVMAEVSDIRKRISPAGSTATIVLMEDCNQAVYDIAGIRLDEDGTNLDRYDARLNEANQVVVNLRERECTRRTSDNLRAPATCDQ